MYENFSTFCLPCTGEKRPFIVLHCEIR
jgi:hypothetical protein